MTRRTRLALCITCLGFGCTPSQPDGAQGPAPAGGDSAKTATGGSGASAPSPAPAPTPAPSSGASAPAPAADAAGATAAKKEPDRITVQHILIAFKGTLPTKPIARSQEEARKLAEAILTKARSGEDFDTLVEQYTDDSAPGIYKMANHGVPADRSQGVYPRGQMVAAFGDVGFPLAVGEFGLAPYDPVKSKYGWHIIKRIE